MTSINVLQIFLLYLYLPYQLWPLEKETICCKRVDFSNLLKLAIMTFIKCTCRLEDSNLNLEDSDPMLHLKVPPLRDLDPLCEGFRYLVWGIQMPMPCLETETILTKKRFRSFIRGFRSFMCSWLVFHFFEWKIRIPILEIRIFFHSSSFIWILY